MKCIVTGGAGFIGSHIVDLLVKEGMDVLVLDNLSTGVKKNLNAAAKFVALDIRDPAALERHCQDVDLFFHAAALPRIQPSFEQPVEHEEVNVVGTIRCLEAVKGTSIQKFVFCSSSAIYGTAKLLPTPEEAPAELLNPYALQKYTAEQYCLILGRRLEIPSVVLRYFSVYGPRSYSESNPYSAYTSAVGVFHRQHRAGTPLTVTGDGEQSRDFVHVYDVARANLMAALSDSRFETYNVGSGASVTVNRTARMFSTDITYIPERPNEARVTQADIGKIRRDIGWAPAITLETGVRLLDG
jgi:UDP-glucose 4-epimerase